MEDFQPSNVLPSVRAEKPGSTSAAARGKAVVKNAAVIKAKGKWYRMGRTIDLRLNGASQKMNGKSETRRSKAERSQKPEARTGHRE